MRCVTPVTCVYEIRRTRQGFRICIGNPKEIWYYSWERIAGRRARYSQGIPRETMVLSNFVPVPKAISE